MKAFTTKQEASEFFETLSEADYIFFANECSKFVNHPYNAENIEKSLRSLNLHLLDENKTLQREKQKLEEEIKALEQNHKTEKERFEKKLQNEQLIELTKIREEEERFYNKKYKNDMDKKENEKKSLEKELTTECENKCEYEKIWKERCQKFKDDTKHLVKKSEKSQGLCKS